MNYNSVILVGILVLTTFWWFVHGMRKYPGPKLAKMYGAGKVIDLPNEGMDRKEGEGGGQGAME